MTQQPLPLAHHPLSQKQEERVQEVVARRVAETILGDLQWFIENAPGRRKQSGAERFLEYRKGDLMWWENLVREVGTELGWYYVLDYQTLWKRYARQQT